MRIGTSYCCWLGLTPPQRLTFAALGGAYGAHGHLLHRCHWAGRTDNYRLCVPGGAGHRVSFCFRHRLSHQALNN